jgi:hypothetical protein
MHSLQRFVPAPLKLTGHQTIGGIDGIVLSTGMGGLVPRLLQRQLELSSEEAAKTRDAAK